MRRRDLITLVSSSALAVPSAAFGQSAARTYRIGLLGAGMVLTDDSPNGKSLIRGLAERGYVLGKNIVFERRYAQGQIDRLPDLAGELAASKLDVIIASGYPAVLAAKSTGLPVVAINAGDPVATGLVAGLARPGGNLTGISDVSVEMTPKRIELLKEMVPALRRVAVLWNANDLGMTMRYRAAEAGAKVFGIEIQPLGVREPDDLDEAFAGMKSKMPDAILMVTDSLTVLNRKRVFAFAAANRLPGIYEFVFLVRDGGLMSYGPDDDESYVRVAALADRVLKGASPAELPFERPTLFKLAINTTTAKALGLNVPATLLARADDVFE